MFLLKILLALKVCEEDDCQLLPPTFSSVSVKFTELYYSTSLFVKVHLKLR